MTRVKIFYEILWGLHDRFLKLSFEILDLRWRFRAGIFNAPIFMKFMKEIVLEKIFDAYFSLLTIFRVIGMKTAPKLKIYMRISSQRNI